jgi:hypothetical protein
LILKGLQLVGEADVQNSSKSCCKRIKQSAEGLTLPGEYGETYRRKWAF